MTCHHYCNEPFRCHECARQFYAWAQARTNSQPGRRVRNGVRTRPEGSPNFYDHVNRIAEPIVVYPSPQWVDQATHHGTVALDEIAPE